MEVNCYAAILLGIECELPAEEEDKDGSRPPTKANTETEANNQQNTNVSVNKVVQGSHTHSVFVSNNTQSAVKSNSDDNLDSGSSISSSNTISCRNGVCTNSTVICTNGVCVNHTSAGDASSGLGNVEQIVLDGSVDNFKDEDVPEPDSDDEVGDIGMATGQSINEKEEDVEPIEESDLKSNHTEDAVEEETVREEVEGFERQGDVSLKVAGASRVNNRCGVLGGRGLLEAFGAAAAHDLLPDLVANWVTGHPTRQAASEHVGGGVVTSTVIYCWMAAVVRMRKEPGEDKEEEVEEMLCTASLVHTDLVITSAACTVE